MSLSPARRQTPGRESRGSFGLWGPGGAPINTLRGQHRDISAVMACWNPLAPQGLGSGRSIRVSGGRGDQPGYDAAAAPKASRTPTGVTGAFRRALPPLPSGQGESLSVSLLGLPGGLWGARGHLVPVGLRYGRLSQTAWARKTPRRAPPQPLGEHRAHGDRQGRLGREGPPWVRWWARLALPCRTPSDPRGEGSKQGPRGLRSPRKSRCAANAF
jgi:hypothetical protein